NTLPADPVLRKDSFIPLACLMLTGCLANDPGLKEFVERTTATTVTAFEQVERERGEPAVRRHVTIARLIAIVCRTFLGEHQPLAALAAQLDARTGDAMADAVGTIVRGIIHTVRGRKQAMAEPADALAELRRGGYGTIATLLAALVEKSATVVASGVALSKTEVEILRQMASGLGASEIAQARHSSITTVRTHIKNLYRKLDVSSAAAAINRGRSLGVL
ncbi:MAG TPA: LuxR C-terminal-related transcriptional regulator, partial [Candidatus Acidoferrales bacterium]|nr:LuxR C-terminal-related transcriptional regulator [Candidatus Acidoferrales bacterium]